MVNTNSGWFAALFAIVLAVSSLGLSTLTDQMEFKVVIFVVMYVLGFIVSNKLGWSGAGTAADESLKTE